MRAAAVMAKLFVRGVSPSCDGPHAKDRILQCGTGVRALSFGWTKLNLVVVVLNLHDCLAEQMAVGHGSGMGGLRKAGPFAYWRTICVGPVNTEGLLDL